MKTLMVFLLLGVSAYGFIKEDGKSAAAQDARKVQTPEDITITKRDANAVIRRHKRQYDYYERWYPRVKNPLELKMERCENYWPCDQLSEWVGFYQAYQQYFGPV